MQDSYTITMKQLYAAMDDGFNPIVIINGEYYNITDKPKYPCRNCKYFDECGENMRTVPCNGRETKGGSSNG